MVQSQTGLAAGRWSGFAAALYNTYRYYSQFLELMQKAISDSLAELEKQLQVAQQPAPAACLAAAVRLLLLQSFMGLCHDQQEATLLRLYASVLPFVP